MHWQLSTRADVRAVRIADRHYNRQKPGTPQFVPPGSCLVFYAETDIGGAVWVTSRPFGEYVKHAWAGAWVNTIFRNESGILSSTLIREAVSATLAIWVEPPVLGIISFIDERKVRHKRDPGRCYRKAGWTRLDQRTKKDHLIVYQILPEQMNQPDPAVFTQMRLISQRPNRVTSGRGDLNGQGVS